MEKKMKSWLALLNPFRWFAALFEPLLRFLGLMPRPRTEEFQNIQREDVNEAAEQAKRTEEAVDAILRDMSPAEVVKAYAAASPKDRALMDLSALDADGQDWLQSLSGNELTLLSMSTTAGCARSLEARTVKPVYRKPIDEKEAEILSIPAPVDGEEEKRQFITARVRELFHAPGVPNINPRYIPGNTIH